MPAAISIVIVSYNVSGLLRNCLRSIEEQIGPSTEIIVADNASSDDSVEMVKNEFPDVILIPNKENVGFSAANNMGMQLASGKYIFLLNPDTEVRGGALQAMFEFGEKQDRLFILGPRLENKDASLQISAWEKPKVADMILESLFLHKLFGVSGYTREMFQNEFSPGMLSGAALFFPAELFKKIGGLDPALFWMEDADFCKRAAEAGAKLVYFPPAAVVHYSGESSKKNLKVVISNQLLSKLKFYKKHYGGFAFGVAAFFCFIHIGTRWTGLLLASVFNRKYREKLVAYDYAFRKFFRFLFNHDNSLT